MNAKSKYPKEIIKKASVIKAIFCDVDGVLSNGRILYNEAGQEAKQFHVRDGLIIPHLRKAGIICGVISSHESEVVKLHSARIGMDFCHQGIVDKLSVVQKLVKHHQLKAREIAFIGDDINDLKSFRYVGLAVCPPDAPDYIRSEADWITGTKSGNGVLREVADLVLAAKGVFEKILSK